MGVLFPKTINYIAITGTRVKGVWTPSETPGTFIGDVQPVSGKDLESLPVGRKEVGMVKIYSNTSLNISQEGTEHSGDIVLWQGKKWEIVQEMPFQNDLINHYKYIGEDRGAIA